MSNRERIKKEIKKLLLDFWEKHKDFNDRNPKHIKEAEAFGNFLKQICGDERIIIEAIEELKDELEKEVAKARERFYKKIREIQNEYKRKR
jgi:hypothetical protein